VTINYYPRFVFLIWQYHKLQKTEVLVFSRSALKELRVSELQGQWSAALERL